MILEVPAVFPPVVLAITALLIALAVVLRHYAFKLGRRNLRWAYYALIPLIIIAVAESVYITWFWLEASRV